MGNTTSAERITPSEKATEGGIRHNDTVDRNHDNTTTGSFDEETIQMTSDASQAHRLEGIPGLDGMTDSEDQVGNRAERSGAKPQDEDYRWSDLFVDAVDMLTASSLCFSIGYILHVARTTEGGLVGLKVVEKGRVRRDDKHLGKLPRQADATADIKSTALNNVRGSFTPAEVAQIIEENEETLKGKMPKVFDDTGHMNNLERLQRRAAESGLYRPITMLEYDDRYQEHEMVYAIAKDDINKRITLVFRGTDNELSPWNNWSANLYIKKTHVSLPNFDEVNYENYTDGDTMGLHSGFYHYVFDTTYSKSDRPDKRKYDEILEGLASLLEQHPRYKVFVTGHSLGGALAAIVSLYLASEGDDVIPKPVTCITFAAPRVGDSKYLTASQTLEKQLALRHSRFVNQHDSVPLAPMWNYHHAGFQIRLPNSEAGRPELAYPKINDSAYNRWKRTWGNSIIPNLNVAYDHSIAEYQRRIGEHKDYMEAMRLNRLYKDKELTGF